jgi:hypothetical protein
MTVELFRKQKIIIRKLKFKNIIYNLFFKSHEYKKNVIWVL